MLFASFGASAADAIFGLTPTRFDIGVEGPVGAIRPERADPFPSRMAAANDCSTFLPVLSFSGIPILSRLRFRRSSALLAANAAEPVDGPASDILASRSLSTSPLPLRMVEARPLRFAIVDGREGKPVGALDVDGLLLVVNILRVSKSNKADDLYAQDRESKEEWVG